MRGDLQTSSTNLKPPITTASPTLPESSQDGETHQDPSIPMTTYRRNHIPGGVYFFTVAIAYRRSDLLLRHIEAFRAAYREEKHLHPFATLGLAVLPDHLHAIWRLPPGDADYSNRWRRIKGRFTAAMPTGEHVSASRASKGGGLAARHHSQLCGARRASSGLEWRGRGRGRVWRIIVAEKARWVSLRSTHPTGR